MGYRLHYAQHYAPEWKGGAFNWSQEEWESLFNAKFFDNGWKAEYEDQYEVQRSDVDDYIKELKKLPPEDFNEFFPNDAGEGYKNKDVIEELEEILQSDDDNIRLEWF